MATSSNLIFSGSIVVFLEPAGNLIGRRQADRFQSHGQAQRAEHGHQRRHGGVLASFKPIDNLAHFAGFVGALVPVWLGMALYGRQNSRLRWLWGGLAGLSLAATLAVGAFSRAWYHRGSVR